MKLNKTKSKKPTVKNPILINAAQIALEHPETFQRPADDEIKTLATGQSVKVCNGLERFWVNVENSNFPFFTGKVNNYLLFPNGLRFGGRIAFHADNVFDIQQPARNPADCGTWAI